MKNFSYHIFKHTPTCFTFSLNNLKCWNQQKLWKYVMGNNAHADFKDLTYVFITQTEYLYIMAYVWLWHHIVFGKSYIYQQQKKSVKAYCIVSFSFDYTLCFPNQSEPFIVNWVRMKLCVLYIFIPNYPMYSFILK